MILFPPVRWRWLNRLYARYYRYFWLPCPICGEGFGGHEWLPEHDLWRTEERATGVCYKNACYLEAQRRSAPLIAKRNRLIAAGAVDLGTFNIGPH